jgi:hypothetical protein
MTIPSIAATVALLCSPACGGKDKPSAAQPSRSAPATTAPAPDTRNIDPADFGLTIDNPYLPMKPGTRTVYRGRGDGAAERDVVVVTDRTRTIMGVTCVVVRDTVSRGGAVTEDTYDWFAQDRRGRVWYFGEDTREYEHGRVSSTKGSWEAGVDGAVPGIVMTAPPKVGDAYRQEFLKGEAEDRARVLSVTATATVAFGSFRDVVVTEERTRLEPDIVGRKYYAKGVGVIREFDVRGSHDHSELVSVDPA